MTFITTPWVISWFSARAIKPENARSPMTSAAQNLTTAPPMMTCRSLGRQASWLGVPQAAPAQAPAAAAAPVQRTSA